MKINNSAPNGPVTAPKTGKSAGVSSGVKQQPAIPVSGYTTDLEMLADYYTLIDLKKLAKSQDKEATPKHDGVKLLAEKIQSRLSTARPAKDGAFLLGKYIDLRLNPMECLLMATVCYYHARPDDKYSISDIFDIVCDYNRTHMVGLHKYLNTNQRLIKSALLDIKRNPPIYQAPFTLKLGRVVEERLFGRLSEAAANRRKRNDAPLEQPAISVLSPKEIYQAISKHVIGQEKAKQAIAVSVYNHCQRIGGMAGLDKTNIFLAGPTGCGKTHLVETVSRILDVPFYIADATQYSETGYFGRNVEDMFDELYHAADSDPVRAARGIIYIDEIDKIAATIDNGKHKSYRDVSGESVQEELLKAIEGTDYPNPQFDNKNVLFMAGGAFSSLIKHGQGDRSKTIGFGRCQDEASRPSVLSPTIDDFVAFGMLPELMGRFQLRVLLDNLDEETLRCILTEPEDAIIRQYQQTFKANGISLSFSDAALVGIARKAAALKTGARALKSIIEQLLNPLMFEYFGAEVENRTITVDEVMVAMA